MKESVIYPAKSIGRLLLQVLLLLVALSSSAVGSEVVFYMLDKSQSMATPATEKEHKTIFSLAKERILEDIRQRPPQPGVRRLMLVSFDSELHRSLAKSELFGIEHAEETLNSLKTGGNTCIGDRLVDVQNLLKQMQADYVEIQLFSDLQENAPGTTPLPEAVSMLDALMNKEQKHLDIRLICFTWQGNPPARVQQVIDTELPTETHPLDKKLLRYELSPPSELMLDILEREGLPTGVKPGLITEMHGSIAPQLLKHGYRLRVQAYIAADPRQRLTFNGQSVLEVGPDLVDPASGRFVLKGLSVSLPDAEVFLRERMSMLEQPWELIFETTLVEPPNANLPSHFEVLKPDPRRSSLRLVAKASLALISPDGSYFSNTLFLGDDCRIPVVIIWNHAAVGQEVLVQVPHPVGGQAARLFDASGHPVGDRITLNQDLYQSLRLEYRDLRAVVDGSLSFTPAGRRDVIAGADIKIYPQRPMVSVAMAEMAQPLRLPGGITREFEGVLRLHPHSSRRDLSLMAQLKVSNSFKAELFDPLDPELVIAGNAPAQSIELKQPRNMSLRVEAGSGEGELRLLLGSPSPSPAGFMVDGRETHDFMRRLSLGEVQPVLEWSFTMADGQSLGTQASPLALAYREGAEVRLYDPESIQAGNFARCVLRPADMLDALGHIRLRAEVETLHTQFWLRGDREAVVNGALFEANGKPEITLREFIRNPYVRLQVDTSLVPLSGGYKMTYLRIDLRPADIAEAGHLQLPSFFASVKVRE